jgi:hypothetical protein
VPFALGLYLPKNELFYVSRVGAVAEEPSESGNNTHFQRHSCPGPDFWSGNRKKGLFKPKYSPGSDKNAAFSDL